MKNKFYTFVAQQLLIRETARRQKKFQLTAEIKVNNFGFVAELTKSINHYDSTFSEFHGWPNYIKAIFYSVERFYCRKHDFRIRNGRKIKVVRHSCNNIGFR